MLTHVITKKCSKDRNNAKVENREKIQNKGKKN